MGNLTVNAQAMDTFRASAIGAALSLSEFAIGGAVSDAHESNQAFASIDSTAGVNASGALAVTAEATLPLVLIPVEQYDQLKQFFENETSSGTPLFEPGSITSVSGLISTLSAQNDPVSDYIWSQIPATDQQTLLSTSSTPEQQESTLDADLDAILTSGSSIYTATRFAGVTLSQATLNLLNSNPTGEQLELLNRMLLDDAYANDISSSLPGVIPQVDNTGLNGQTFDEVDSYLTRLQLGEALLSDLPSYISPTGNAPATVTTTYVGAASQSGDSDKETQTPSRLSVSGSVNLLTMVNTAKAGISDGARINLDSAYALPGQSVDVDASATTNAIDAGGFTALPTIVISTEHGSTSVGGTFVDLHFTNTANAYIGAGAMVDSAGDVDVESHTNNFLVNLTKQGGAGHKYGIEGGVAYTSLDNQSLAYIDASATVQAAGNVTVHADNTLFALMITGADSQAPDRGRRVGRVEPVPERHAGVHRQSRPSFGRRARGNGYRRRQCHGRGDHQGGGLLVFARGVDLKWRRRT